MPFCCKLKFYWCWKFWKLERLNYRENVGNGNICKPKTTSTNQSVYPTAVCLSVLQSWFWVAGRWNCRTPAADRADSLTLAAAWLLCCWRTGRAASRSPLTWLKVNKHLHGVLFISAFQPGIDRNQDELNFIVDRSPMKISLKLILLQGLGYLLPVGNEPMSMASRCTQMEAAISATHSVLVDANEITWQSDSQINNQFFQDCIPVGM